MVQELERSTGSTQNLTRVRNRLRKSMVVAAVAVGLVAMTAVPAMASSYDGTLAARSIYTFDPGTLTFNQLHSGDDIAFQVFSGIAVDMKWVNCTRTQSGSIQSNINSSQGYRTLGTNFLAGSCLHIDYRGWSQTGSFTGRTYWNFNFA